MCPVRDFEPALAAAVLAAAGTVPRRSVDRLVLLGEIGLDMSVFGTARWLCSWAKISPRTVELGRQRGRARTGKGNRYLRAALGQMVVGAAKTDTFLSERYRRLVNGCPRPRRQTGACQIVCVSA